MEEKGDLDESEGMAHEIHTQGSSILENLMGQSEKLKVSVFLSWKRKQEKEQNKW